MTRARVMLALRQVASWIDGLTDWRHLVTDPACQQYSRPRPGSRLDRASRGQECRLCMFRRAWDSGVKRGTCTRPPAGFYWCSLDAGHDGPCPARSEQFDPPAASRG